MLPVNVARSERMNDLCRDVKRHGERRRQEQYEADEPGRHGRNVRFSPGRFWHPVTSGSCTIMGQIGRKRRVRLGLHFSGTGGCG